MATTGLDLDRTQILAHRRQVGALDNRLQDSPSSLERAAWAGLQDSMPRAAILSIHARVEGTTADVLENPALVQLWGPRFNAYVVAARDIGVFTLGRLPPDGARRKLGEDLADRLDDVLAGSSMTAAEAGRALGVHHNQLRYAAPTGRVLIDWDGARRPTIWTVPPPAMDPDHARLELARRYLHVMGPGTPDSYARWAGIRPERARAVFDELGDELIPLTTPIGVARILAGDEGRFRADPIPPGPARLLPSGDTYYLHQGDDRALLVPDAGRRPLLWTSRVWPGAVLVDGEIVGIWRRAGRKVTVELWQRLTVAQREAVEREAATLPLPGLEGEIQVAWNI